MTSAALTQKPCAVVRRALAHLDQVAHDVAVRLVDCAGLIGIERALHGAARDAVGVFMGNDVQRLAVAVDLTAAEARPAVVEAVEAGIVFGLALGVAHVHGNQDGRLEAVDGADVHARVIIIGADIIIIGNKIVPVPCGIVRRRDEVELIAEVERRVVRDHNLALDVGKIIKSVLCIIGHRHGELAHAAVKERHASRKGRRREVLEIVVGLVRIGQLRADGGRRYGGQILSGVGHKMLDKGHIKGH